MRWKKLRLGGCWPAATKPGHGSGSPRRSSLGVRITTRYAYDRDDDASDASSTSPTRACASPLPPPSPASSTAPLNPLPPPANVLPPSRPVASLKPSPSTVSLPRRISRKRRSAGTLGSSPTTSTAAAAAGAGTVLPNAYSTPPSSPPRATTGTPSILDGGVSCLPCVDITPFELAFTDVGMELEEREPERKEDRVKTAADTAAAAVQPPPAPFVTVVSPSGTKTAIVEAVAEEKIEEKTKEERAKEVGEVVEEVVEEMIEEVVKMEGGEDETAFGLGHLAECVELPVPGAPREERPEVPRDEFWAPRSPSPEPEAIVPHRGLQPLKSILKNPHSASTSTVSSAISTTSSAPASITVSDIDSDSDIDMATSIPDTAHAGGDAPSAPMSSSPKKGKKPQPAPQPAAAADGATKKLTGKELKEAKKAEKQARRAAEKVERSVGGAPASTPAGSSRPTSHGAGPASPAGVLKQSQQQTPKSKKAQVADDAQDDGPLRKIMPLFEHLREEKPPIELNKLNKDVHPAVAKLSLKLRNFEIMGSTARCLYTLMAFKEVIKDYKTPKDTSLARNLTQHLGVQISQIALGRKLSISQGNAIRWLKTIIIDVKPDVPESEAKEELLVNIDNYIKERIIAAQEVIARIAADKIHDGYTVLTFAKSSCVERVIREAAFQGKKFKVICIDSRPYFEGKKLAASLSEAGIDVKYTFLHALDHVMSKVDVVIVGAHSMFSNGACYSRAGTASVAITANAYKKPVLVCCEGIKLSDKIALDSITMNELGPAEHLIDDESPLANHADIPNLSIVNLLFDVTAAKYITSVVTEVGLVAPTGVPSVHRLISEREGTVGAS
ncbi:hypothetical protein TWF696_006451 [Orbilia brochopaga]|uniref:Translation initiation factor eIF2B subunit delta n=1 Tax=Orbilia brochopaga TaxID=3140254 RepID=A0AAV9UX81_9PEZI